MLFLLPLLLAASAPPDSPGPYPRTVAEVPAAFHGGWDEFDACENREPRFSITARYFYNFEVIWKVRKVRLYGPAEIDILAVPWHPEANEFVEEPTTWMIRLVDNGRAIAARKGGATEFLTCTDTLGRK